MKKLLLSLLLVSSIHTFAQEVVYSEDCSGLVLGNIGTDLTGVTPGQSGLTTYVATTASPAGQNSDFQVVDMGGANGYAIKIVGSSSATGTRFLEKDITTNWTNRTFGDDVAQIEFDFFTGPVTTDTKNAFRCYIYDSSGTKILSGLLIDMSTKAIYGVAYATGTGGDANGAYYLNGSSTDVILEDNTWYRLGLSYDYNTGDVRWKDLSGQALFYGGLTGAAAGTEISRASFGMGAGTGNTVSTTGVIDNIRVSLVPAEILGVNNSPLVSNKFSVYPNPVKDVITVTNTESIAVNGITITDLNGRTVKTVNYNNISDNIQVNVSDLSSGVYMMNIKSDKGSVTKKIVKN